MSNDNSWYFKDALFGRDEYNKAVEDGFIGFVYEITNTVENKKYIGKKLFLSRRKLKPLKGKTRGRLKIVESDWNTYYGSSEKLQLLVSEDPTIFAREILFLCKTKGELNYVEIREQILREVLLSDKFYNGIINCKIHAKHVRRLWHE